MDLESAVVEPDPDQIDPTRTNPGPEAGDPGPLRVVEGVDGVVSLGAGADFDCDQGGTVAGDDVDLASRDNNIAGHDPHPVIAQEPAGDPLPRGAEPAAGAGQSLSSDLSSSSMLTSRKVRT